MLTVCDNCLALEIRNASSAIVPYMVERSTLVVLVDIIDDEGSSDIFYQFQTPMMLLRLGDDLDSDPETPKDLVELASDTDRLVCAVCWQPQKTESQGT